MTELTQEQLMIQGKIWRDVFFPWLTIKERLADLNPEDMDALLEVPAINHIWDKSREEGIEKGIEKGREEGIEKGREKGREEGIEKGLEESRKVLLKTLDQVLALRFETPPNHFDEQLKKLDLTALKELNDAVFKVSTLAEFETMLLEVLAKGETSSSESLESWYSHGIGLKSASHAT